MTICIAATCDCSNEPKIILCSDWQASTIVGASETTFKQRLLRKAWTAMYAGNASAALGLHSELASRFRGSHPIDDASAIQSVRGAMNARKKTLADEYIQGRYGLSYDDFLKIGKERLPGDLYLMAISTIRDMTIGVECIVAGFDGAYPVLIRGDEQCRVSIRESFTCIGEGEYLASSVLVHRAHDEMSPMNQSLYCVYEAKRYAERVRSVGKTTSLTIRYRDGSSHLVTAKGRELLSKKFDEYGPKEIGAIALTDECLRHHSGEPKSSASPSEGEQAS